MRYGYLLFLLFFSNLSYAEEEINYWQCNANDSIHGQWMAKSNYSITARAKALEACKRESKDPTSCIADKDHCNFIGTEQKEENDIEEAQHSAPGWQCTAIDHSAASWEGTPSMRQEEAYLNAKTRCKQQSSEPETCYVNVLTCK